MTTQVIEGTWDEIERRKSELIGHYLRVTIEPTKRQVAKTNGSAKKPTASPQPKVLTGFGAFKGKFGGSEALAQAKQVEIDIEDSKFERRP